MATNQYTEFGIILYEFPTTDLLLLLGVQEYAFIEHDMDLTENGEFKKTHYHLYIKLNKKKTFGGVYEILNNWKENCTQSNLIINIKNKPKFIRYFTHIDDLDKTQYPITDILTNIDIDNYFSIELTDSLFTKNILKLIDDKQIDTFRDIVNYSLNMGKLDLIMKRAYFFKNLLK